MTLIIKKIITLFLIISSLLVTSCVTRYVKKEMDRSYKEDFKGYYVSKYGNDLIFIGNQYHYVFKDRRGEISKLVKVKWKSELIISDINLSVNKDNKVNGNVSLEIKSPITYLGKKQIDSMKKYGFQEQYHKILTKKIVLDGTRYKPGKGFSSKEKNNFSKGYYTTIKYTPGNWEKTKEAAITPIAYAADGLLIIAGGVWMPLIVLAVINAQDP